jgi:hypothetical protein
MGELYAEQASMLERPEGLLYPPSGLLVGQGMRQGAQRHECHIALALPMLQKYQSS